MAIKYYERKYDKRMGGDYVSLYDDSVKFVKNERVNRDSFGKLFLESTGEPIEYIQIAEKSSNIAGLHHETELNDEFVILGDYIDVVPDPNKKSGLL